MSLWVFLQLAGFFTALVGIGMLLMWAIFGDSPHW